MRSRGIWLVGHFLHAEDGPLAVEYALLLALLFLMASESPLKALGLLAIDRRQALIALMDGQPTQASGASEVPLPAPTANATGLAERMMPPQGRP